jgi:sec-independent protein translocase protein TatC
MAVKSEVISEAVKASDEKRMSIMDHFREMRKRVINSVAGIVAGMVICFIFANQIFKFLEAPAGPNFHPVALQVMETISVYFKVCLEAGFVLAMPWVVYQLFAFLAPALTSKEKRFVLTWIPFVFFMFLLGAAFAYYIALPRALQFLIHFNIGGVVPEISITNYVNVVTQMLLAAGIAFETPVILMVLARLGIVTSQWLAKQRRWWIVIAFVLAAIITPTPDPVNQTIVAIPLILLYELSIFLTRMVQKKKRQVVVSA